MKKKIILFTSLLLLFSYGCRSTKNIHSYTYINGDADLITLRCKGYGSTEQVAIADACRFATEQILFRGIPNSTQRDPLLDINENKARSQFPDYLSDLLDHGRCSSFAVSSSLIESGKTNGSRWRIYDITINIRALRHDLEQNGIIRKFGY